MKEQYNNSKRNKVLVTLAILVALGVGYNIGNNDGKEASFNKTDTTSTKVADVPVTKETPKPKVYSDGTYEIGKDIPVGKYISVADSCYWGINRDANGEDIITNGIQDGQQIVELTTAGQYFKISRCAFTEAK